MLKSSNNAAAYVTAYFKSKIIYVVDLQDVPYCDH